MTRRQWVVVAAVAAVLAAIVIAVIVARASPESSGPDAATPTSSPSGVTPSTPSASPADTSPAVSPGGSASPSTSGPPADDGKPLVTIETPTPGESVRLPVHVSGTAVAFEATLRWEILDSAGKLFTNGPAYADQGAPERGHWEVDVELPLGTWTVVAFIESAKDGTRLAEASVPFSAG